MCVQTMHHVMAQNVLLETFAFFFFLSLLGKPPLEYMALACTVKRGVNDDDEGSEGSMNCVVPVILRL